MLFIKMILNKLFEFKQILNRNYGDLTLKYKLSVVVVSHSQLVICRIDPLDRFIIRFRLKY